MTVTPEQSAPPTAAVPWPLRFFQFIFVVFFWIAAGLVANFFGCLAHRYHDDNLYVDLGSIPLFVFCVSVFICILTASLVGQDRLIDFKRQRITFVAASFIAAVVTGYFLYSPCGSTP